MLSVSPSIVFAFPSDHVSVLVAPGIHLSFALPPPPPLSLCFSPSAPLARANRVKALSAEQLLLLNGFHINLSRTRAHTH